VNDVVRLCSENPARRFGLYPRKGCLQIGSDADVTIVDMSKEETFTKANMHSKAGHTSWEGMRVKGTPVYTIVRGTTVMDHGRITSAPGFGQFVPGGRLAAAQ